MLLDPIQSRVLIADALKHRYAVLAVNADSPAAITDCLEAARICKSPIIIETSLWQLTGHSFGAGDAIVGMARYLAQLAVLAESDRYRDVPIIYHTDHIKGPETQRILTAAIRGIPLRIGALQVSLRASTVSLDSSELSAEQNVALIGELCQAAKDASQPATLEMEAGVDDGVTPLAVAEELLGEVERQHPGYVWLWAPGLGSRHGFSAEGFPEFRPAAAGEHRELARRLLGRDIGIALHGSSGLPESALKEAVAAGVAKVNWSSESLLLRSAASASYYAENAPALEKSHPKFKSTAMDNGQQTWISARYIPAVCDRIRLLGGENAGPRVAQKI
jgi:fructose/tagatose bisphosphate aldolase